MDTITISDARQFSTSSIQKSDLVRSDDLHMWLICFEAGQRDDEAGYDKTCVYQVLEGEAILRQGDVSKRLSKGKLHTMPANTAHVLENAGGGLLVVMATRAL